jgi:hypothetical protein
LRLAYPLRPLRQAHRRCASAAAIALALVLVILIFLIWLSVARPPFVF